MPNCLLSMLFVRRPCVLQRVPLVKLFVAQTVSVLRVLSLFLTTDTLFAFPLPVLPKEVSTLTLLGRKSSYGPEISPSVRACWHNSSGRSTFYIIFSLYIGCAYFTRITSSFSVGYSMSVVHRSLSLIVAPLAAETFTTERFLF